MLNMQCLILLRIISKYMLPWALSVLSFTNKRRISQTENETRVRIISCVSIKHSVNYTINYGDGQQKLLFFFIESIVSISMPFSHLSNDKWKMCAYRRSLHCHYIPIWSDLQRFTNAKYAWNAMHFKSCHLFAQSNILCVDIMPADINCQCNKNKNTRWRTNNAYEAHCLEQFWCIQ